MIQNSTIDSSCLGIQFLPVEKKLYFKIQSLLRKLELKFASLKETFFLYRDQLIWYTNALDFSIKTQNNH